MKKIVIKSHTLVRYLQRYMCDRPIHSQYLTSILLYATNWIFNAQGVHARIDYTYSADCRVFHITTINKYGSFSYLRDPGLAKPYLRRYYVNLQA